MKRIIYGVLIIATLSNCSKEAEEKAGIIVTQAYLRISSEKDPLLQKALYRTLSSSEKASVWKHHVQSVSNVLKVSPVQKSLINEALEFFTEKNFGPVSQLKNSDKYIIWQQRMFDNFDKNVAYILFASLNEVPVNNNAPVACSCASTSDWCNVPQGGTTFYCKTEGCGIVVSDCGTFWNYDCNGGCAFRPANPF